jgi:hypothetical protein
MISAHRDQMRPVELGDILSITERHGSSSIFLPIARPSLDNAAIAKRGCSEAARLHAHGSIGKAEGFGQ